MDIQKMPLEDYRNAQDCRDLDHIPGNYGAVPYIGNTLALVNDLYGFIDKTYKQYGEVSKIKIAGQVGVLVVGADNYKQIFLDRDKSFSAEMGYDSSLGHFFNRGLLLLDGDEHCIKRRMFQTAFKNDQMKGYVEIINPLLQENLQSWNGQKDFLFFPAVKKALLDVGATVFIGVEELGAEMDEMNQAFLNITEKGLMGLFKLDVPGFKFNKGKKGAKFLDNYFLDLIPKRRAGDGRDMLSYMTKERQENGEYFPDSDLVSQASFLLFAAHDTTTSTLNHVILHLAQHPEWQDKLREESRALGKEFLDYDDLARMEMMELVFKETLRMNPSLSLMLRRTTKETVVGGQTLPANTILFIPPVYNHFMEEHWTNPTQFDPMRFSPPRNEHKNHSYCYHPFGGGAHKCIGMHFANMLVKSMLHQMLLNYEWTLPADYTPKMEAFPLPKTADGLPLILKKIG